MTKSHRSPGFVCVCERERERKREREREEEEEERERERERKRGGGERERDAKTLIRVGIVLQYNYILTLSQRFLLSAEPFTCMTT